MCRFWPSTFCECIVPQHNKEKLGITDEGFEYLERYPWPGNVRELENVIERAVLLSKGKFIGPDDLPNSVKQDWSRQQQTYKPMSLKEALAEPEKNLIRQGTRSPSLEQTGNPRKALQINRTTLFKKMKQYGLYTEAEQLGLA